MNFDEITFLHRYVSNLHMLYIQFKLTEIAYFEVGPKKTGLKLETTPVRHTALEIDVYYLC